MFKLIIPHNQKTRLITKITRITFQPIVTKIRAKPLGVHIDRCLNSDYHIEQLCRMLCQ